MKTDSEQGFEVVVSYLPPFPVRHCCKRDRRYRTVKVNLYHAPVEDNGYQYGHDFHAQATRLVSMTSKSSSGISIASSPSCMEARAAATSISVLPPITRRAGNNVLRHIEHRHSDVKGVRHKVDCHKRLEHPLEEHGSVNVVLRLFRYHADKPSRQDVGNDKPRNGYDYILTKGLYHGEYICVPPLRGLSYLCGDSARLNVYVPEHS